MAGTILIVDDSAANRIVLKVKLAAACYDTLQAATGREALHLAREAAPDAILLDLRLPDLDGLAVCRALRSDPATASVPVIVVSATLDRARRLEALRAGAEEVFSRPVDERLLLARLRSLLRRREGADGLPLGEAAAELGFAEAAAGWEGPARIAIVAGRTEQGHAIRRVLGPHLSHPVALLAREEALALAHERAAPELFLIAADLAGQGDGLSLLSDLAARPATRHASVCILLPASGSAGQRRDLAAMALDLGAGDVLPADIDPEEAALRLAAELARKRRADRLRASLRAGMRLALTDPLTGLANRHAALPRLDRIAARARASGRPFAVMLLDLDRFKAVNDSFGHAAGDAVLAAVARRIAAQLGPGDLAARIGGEEFLVALPDTLPAVARATAERLRAAVEAEAVPLPDGSGATRVTVSIGLALGEGKAASPAEEAAAAMRRADRALLSAKAEGRNQVTVARPAA